MRFADAVARCAMMAGIVIVCGVGALRAQESVDAALVTDIDVRVRDHGSSVIFYDAAGRPCVTSGTVTVYKTIIRFRDGVKMEGRGVNQQFVRERVPVEEFGVAARQSFTPADFKEIVTGRQEPLRALMSRRVKLVKGSQLKLLKQVRFALRMMHNSTQIDAEFPDGAP